MSDLAKIGLLCGDVADAVFPDVNDRAQRQRLALALVDLAREIRMPDYTPSWDNPDEPGAA